MDIYFDFTCPYSRRTGRWWRELGEPARWRPFLLREAHRDDDGPPEWDRGDALERVSVLALALHEAIQAADGDVDAYRWETMESFERGRVQGQQLRELAGRVLGRDLDDEVVQHGVRNVGQSHEQALSLKVFGAPTFVTDSGSAYLKLAEQPTLTAFGRCTTRCLSCWTRRQRWRRSSGPADPMAPAADTRTDGHPGAPSGRHWLRLASHRPRRRQRPQDCQASDAGEVIWCDRVDVTCLRCERAPASAVRDPVPRHGRRLLYLHGALTDPRPPSAVGSV